MIRRFVVLSLLAVLVGLIVMGLPDIARYMKMREM